MKIAKETILTFELKSLFLDQFIGWCIPYPHRKQLDYTQKKLTKTLKSHQKRVEYNLPLKDSKRNC